MTRKRRTGSSRDKKSWLSWLPIPIAVAVITGIVAITSAIIGKFPPIDFGKDTPTPSPTSPVLAEVKFGSINDGEEIELGPEAGAADFVHGTFDRVQEDQEIWLVAWRGSTCYPMDGPATKEPTGVWKHGPLHFFETGSHQLSTVLAMEDASALLRASVGHQEGLPCLPNGAEFVETITVQVVPSRMTETPTPTSTPPSATPAPTESNGNGFNTEGKVCEIAQGDDTNAIFLRQVEFNNLGLPRRTKVDVVLQDTKKEATYVTLELDTGLTGCVVRLSSTLRTALGIPNDTDVPVEQRLDRRLLISESPIEVEVVSIKSGAPVGHQVPTVSGTYVGIPVDRSLWLVVRADSNNYPQNGPAQLAGGSWTHGTVYFGQADSGAGAYTLLAVLADEEASAEFRLHLDGSAIQELPVGAIVYATVGVTRNQ